MATRERIRQAMVCDQCGASVPGKSRFCQRCGAEVIQKGAPRVRVRDEYAQRVFTFGCLITVLIAVVAAFIAGLISKFLGVLVLVAVIIGGVIFMKLLFGSRPK